MPGTKTGALKVAAGRIGVSVAEYATRLDAGEKWCTRCKRWHSRSEFGADPSRSDGLTASCRLARESPAQNGPSRRERRERADRGERWCRDCGAWKPDEEVHAGLCRVHTAERYCQWYADKGAPRVCARVHAPKHGLAPLSVAEQEALLEDVEGLCAYGCGRRSDTWDHVVPVKRGGQTEPGNIVPACRSCNSRKKDRDPWEWFALCPEMNPAVIERLSLLWALPSPTPIET